jgi:hypothetical protein
MIKHGPPLAVHANAYKDVLRRVMRGGGLMARTRIERTARLRFARNS